MARRYETHNALNNRGAQRLLVELIVMCWSHPIVSSAKGNSRSNCAVEVDIYHTGTTLKSALLSLQKCSGCTVSGNHNLLARRFGVLLKFPVHS
ncbi:MAG: hypothetical protein ACI80L_001404 [Pseudohongiellaceae bacterium]|jgi:hypothetical protein